MKNFSNSIERESLVFPSMPSTLEPLLSSRSETYQHSLTVEDNDSKTDDGGDYENKPSKNNVLRFDTSAKPKIMRRTSDAARADYTEAQPSGLFTWGWNSNGQLGFIDLVSRIKPQRLKAFPSRLQVSKVVCGSRFTVAMTSNGHLYSWGRGDDGQLGHGNLISEYVPRIIDALTEAQVEVVDVAARGSHVLALCATGLVYTWGFGDEGQLGTGKRSVLFFLAHYLFFFLRKSYNFVANIIFSKNMFHSTLFKTGGCRGFTRNSNQ